MGFEDVRDREIILARHLDIFVDVRGDAFAVVAHEVGKLGHAVSLDAFEDE